MNPKTAFDLAVRNIHAYGDTDIFPFPIESYVLRDKRDAVVRLLRQAYSYFDKCFGQHRPHHIRTLTPVGISGFRWATQQDPFWNAFLLGSTIALADQIEVARIPVRNPPV